jgi:uncharacterized membrane protein
MAERQRDHLEQERGIWAESGEDLSRVTTFSDGVFAIAATLLALEIRVPEIAGAAPPGAIFAAVWVLAPRILVYMLTFMNISVVWISHHRAFTHIRRYDTPLLWMNAFFLMFVAFLPVASSTLGRYPTRSGAVVFYTAVILLTTLAELQIWLYATSKRRLVDADIDPRVVRYVTLRAVFPAVVFVVAIPVALLNVLPAELMVFSVFFVSIILGRVYSPVLAHVASHPRTQGAQARRALPAVGKRAKGRRLSSSRR